MVFPKHPSRSTSSAPTIPRPDERGEKIRFVIQPDSTKRPLGHPTFIKWQYTIPQELLGQQRQWERSYASARSNDTKNSADIESYHREFMDLHEMAIREMKIHDSTSRSSHNDYSPTPLVKGEIYCHKGQKYTYLGDSCACPTPTPPPIPTPTPTPTPTPRPTPTPTPRPTPTPTPTPAPTPTPTPTTSRSSTASSTPTFTCDDNGIREGWFLISDQGCQALSTKSEQEIIDESINKSAYNDITKVISLGDHNKSSEVDSEYKSWGCGGSCLYEWNVKVTATKNKDSFLVEPIGEVCGPFKHCTHKPVNLNNWAFVDNNDECVSIDSEQKDFEMRYFSHLPTETGNPQCGCDPASECPEWSLDNPYMPKSTIIPVCKEPLTIEEVSSTITSPTSNKGWFKLFDEEMGEETSGYEELYIDEQGWPIELIFPKAAWTNGTLNSSSAAYINFVNDVSPVWQYMTVQFWDANGSAWLRSGFYLPTSSYTK